MRKFIAAVLLVAGSVSPGYGQTIVGQEIHEFTLPDLYGTFRGPKQYRGKILGIFLMGHD